MNYMTGNGAYSGQRTAKIPRRDTPSMKGTGSLSFPPLPSPDAKMDMARGAGNSKLGITDGLRMTGRLGQGPSTSDTSSSERMLPLRNATSTMNSGRLNAARDVLSQGNFGYGLFKRVETMSSEDSANNTPQNADGFTVTTGSVILESTDNRSELPNANDLCIIRVNNNGMGRMQVKRTFDGARQVYPTAKAFTLPAINRFLAERQIAAIERMSPNDMSLEGLLDGPWDDTYEFFPLNPKSIWANFAPFGILNTASTLTGTYPNVARNPSSRALSGAESRNAGIIVAGLANVRNIWQRRLPVGTNLFLVIRPMRMPGRYVTSTISNSNLASQMTSEISTERARARFMGMTHRQVDYPFQFVPVFSQLAEPPESERVYTSPDGTRRFAPYYRIGYVYKMPDGGPIKYSPEESARNLKFVREQPVIYIDFNKTA